MAPWGDKQMPGVLKAVLVAVQVYAFYYACISAYTIRLHAVNEYGRIIHEFDPWSLHPPPGRTALPRARARVDPVGRARTAGGSTRAAPGRASASGGERFAARDNAAGSRARLRRWRSLCRAGLLRRACSRRFNFRATKYLWENGWTEFFHWYDHMSWYPLGRPVGTTIYPGMQITSVREPRGARAHRVLAACAQ